MGTSPTIDIQMCFKAIFQVLKEESKFIISKTAAFTEGNEICSLKDVEGIFNLDEKHIQYIVYKALLEMGNYEVYMEDPYEKGDRRCCDITMYGQDGKEIWIEIKTTGWCDPGEYRKWIKEDAEKLRTLPQKGARKYLLVTSIEDGKQNGVEWGRWFRNFKGVKFDPNLFGSFFSHDFKYGNKTIKGYYTVCLLKVKPKKQREE